jgi:voltage-gated potassium channel
MQNDIDRLQGHYIVCGYGRVGRQVVEELAARGLSAVVVEPQDDVVTDDEPALLRIRGDATDDSALRAAGIDRAAGLVAVAGDDAINIVVTLSARALNPDLDIVARAIHPEVEDKLRRAGATHVISPYRIGGQRIVTQLLHPQITEFLDVILHRRDLELWLEEITVAADGPANGRPGARRGPPDRRPRRGPARRPPARGRRRPHRPRHPRSARRGPARGRRARTR